jgi:hypothetical protein
MVSNIFLMVRGTEPTIHPLTIHTCEPSDTAHSDTAHSDTAHSDTAHSDTAHSDTARQGGRVFFVFFWDGLSLPAGCHPGATQPRWLSKRT